MVSPAPCASSAPLLLLILTSSLTGIWTQETSSQITPTKRPVNVFVINDEANDIANKSVTNALQGLRGENPELLGKAFVMQINGTDAKGTLDRICSLWSSAIQQRKDFIPDFVLDTTTEGFGAEVVSSFTAALGIPTLSAQFGQEGDIYDWRNINDDQKGYLIQVMPPADLLPEIIRQICSKYNISNAAILFGKGFIMDHKYKSLLLNVPTRHVITPIEEAPTRLQTQIMKLRELDIVNFFVLGDQFSIRNVLEAGQKLNYTGRKYAWYAMTLGNDFSPTCKCDNLSVIFIRPSTQTQNQQTLSELTSKGQLPKPIITSAFYYDLVRIGIYAMKSALESGEWPRVPRYMNCDEYNSNNTPLRKFNFLSKMSSTTASKTFRPTYAGFTWGKKNGQHHSKYETLISMFTITGGHESNEQRIGTWQAGVESPIQITDSVKMSNHTAVTSYRVVTVIKKPFVFKNNETGEWEGYCIDLLNEIRQNMAFEYEIREVEDKDYGTMDEKGNWNGMVKELMFKKADIALGALSVMAERENVIDFTVPYYDLVGISILMKRPKMTTSLFKFLTVLEGDVWLCILGAYLFTSGLMWIFDRWSPYSYQNNRARYQNDEEKREFNLKECLWFCMTSLTPQGGGEAPKNLSGRLVAATWWLFGFIIIASYTANLAAFLTVSRLDAPIESLDDLIKQYKIEYAPIKDSSEYRYFERMAAIEHRFYEIWKDMSLNDSLSNIERAKLAVWDYPVSDKYTKMFQTMQDTGFPKDLDDALARVRGESPDHKNDFAFIGDATDIKFLAMTNCEFVQIGDEFSRKPYAIAVQQGSPLKDQFNNAILVLLNKRRLEKLKDTWWHRKIDRKQCSKQDNQSDGISIQNIGGVFIVIFVGIALACVTLIGEYYYYRCRPKVKNLNSTSKKIEIAPNPKRFNLRPAPMQNTKDMSDLPSRF